MKSFLYVIVQILFY